MILKMGTVKFHPQGNWKPLGSPLTFALHICFILKGIESQIRILHNSHQYHCFILKGIERLIRNYLQFGIIPKFHPQGNWKWEKNKHKNKTLKNVSSSRELKDFSTLSLLFNTTKFHPQGNWKKHRPQVPCWWQTIYQFHPQGNWKNNLHSCYHEDPRKKFHPQGNWKLTCNVIITYARGVSSSRELKATPDVPSL